MTTTQERQDTTSARAAVTPQRAWRAARLPVALGAAVIAVGALLALLTGNVRGGLLDPEAARPPGGKALAGLLRDRGVDVRRVVRPPATSATTATTVFVPDARLLGPGTAAAVLVPGRLRDVVLVAPGEELLARIRRAAPELDVLVLGETEVAVRQPRCELAEAVVAGSAAAGGELYSASGRAGCYGSRGRFGIVVHERSGGRLVVVGAPDGFTNDQLGEAGNAALALGLLGGRQRVDWVYPRASERLTGEGDRTILELLPDQVGLAAVQLGIAALWLAAWRVRRLGPVVAESLPVVVRSAESVEGRAALYRAARARDRAALALRGATQRRIGGALGAGIAPDRDALVAAVAARTGRAAADVDDVLYRRTTSDDAALVRLARDLDAVYSEVRGL